MNTTYLAGALDVAGAAASAVLVRAGARSRDLDARTAIDGLFVMMVAALLTGHVVEVVLYRTSELASDWTIILPGSGGSCSLGAMVGGVLGGYAWFRARARDRFLEHADNLALAVSLGAAIVRLGCFAAHDHLSDVTDSPLAIDMPGGPRHDLGLDEAILCAALFACLKVLDRRPRAPGSLVLTASLVYASGRFVLDFLRAGEARYGGLTLVQFAMALVIAVGAAALVKRRRAFRDRPVSLVA
jgi:phosphatidylglycerol:prolipoprotein diacylglycerol transferase